MNELSKCQICDLYHQNQAVQLTKYIGGQEELYKNYPTNEPSIVLGCGRLFTSESPLSVVSVIKKHLWLQDLYDKHSASCIIGRQRTETTSWAEYINEE